MRLLETGGERKNGGQQTDTKKGTVMLALQRIVCAAR